MEDNKEELYTQTIQRDKKIKCILEGCSSSIIQLQQYINNFYDNDNELYTENIQGLYIDGIQLPTDFIFHWLALFRKEENEIYRAIIFLLIETKICYASMLSTIFKTYRTSAKNFLLKLQDMGIVKPIDIKEFKELSFLRAHKQAFRLTDYDIEQKIQFYELTGIADLFFSNIDCWPDLLHAATIHKIENHKHELSKKAKEVEQEIKQQADVAKKIAADSIRRNKEFHKPTEQQNEFWLKTQSEKTGIPIEKIKKEIGKIQDEEVVP